MFFFVVSFVLFVFAKGSFNSVRVSLNLCFAANNNSVILGKFDWTACFFCSGYGSLLHSCETDAWLPSSLSLHWSGIHSD